MSYMEAMPTVTESKEAAPDFNCGWSFFSLVVRLSAQSEQVDGAKAASSHESRKRPASALV